jgi:heptosyltransferase-2
MGDVIRTTPLLHRLWKKEPDALIWWLTYTPDIVPTSVDRVFPFSPETLTILMATEFDLVINLDKDQQACALTKMISSKRKTGFTLVNGKPEPVDSNATHKFLTGLFDDVSQANTKSYMEEIFEICGWNFQGEEYILGFDDSIKWNIHSGGKKIIGFNTGCGDRWTSRLWAEEKWKEIIQLIQSGGFFPILLGGKQEHEKNSKLSNLTGAFYPGHFSLREFISLVNQCDAVVTAVTMALHIAVGLKKPVVLMNNIFNPNEFDLYGRGSIVQPEQPCKCYFSPRCRNEEYFCMDSLKPESVFNEIKKIFE